MNSFAGFQKSTYLNSWFRPETRFQYFFFFDYYFFSFFSGLSRSPTPRQLERALDELNAGRPQCPVGLHTLIVPRKNSQNIAPEAQPMVYLKCGHVQVLLFSCLVSITKH